VKSEGQKVKGEERGSEPFAAAGVLVVDKPEGLTSHDVVARVRRILRTRRVGHTGTLDPFATGVLVVCVNRATRLAQFLVGDDKEYVATARFGYATDTGDLTGQPLTPVAPTSHVNVEGLREALAHFRGRIRQVPPMYSAKKVGGVKLYEMARRGETVERRPVEVEIKELELCAWPQESSGGQVIPTDSAFALPNTSSPISENADGTRDCGLRVVCSSGTYVRTLAEDVGRRLGVGAHLTRLRRTRAGRSSLAHAVTLEALESLAASGRAAQSLIPMAAALDLPEAFVTEAEQKMILQGRTVRARQTFDGGASVKLTAQGSLLAVARYDALTNSLQPYVVLTSADSSF
jgi:tRNA pseudouridine55 synthase